jgi:hypothetical protein
MAFGSLYTENWTKLVPPKSYPVDSEELITWQNSLGQRGPERRRRFETTFGRVIAGGIQHISFAAFYESLRQVAFQLRDLSQQRNLPIVLVVTLPVGGTPVWRKSNFWSALLMWPHIGDRVIDVVDDNGLERYKVQRLPPGQAPRYLYALVDDAAYSGEQMSANLFRMKFARDGNVVAVAVAAASRQARERLTLAWISATAQQRIGRSDYLPAEFVGVLRCVEIMSFEDTALRVLGAETGAEFTRDMAYFRVQARQTPAEPSEFTFGGGGQGHRGSHLVELVRPGISLAYFDHRLPDDLSTITTLLALAPAETDDGGADLHSLIRGCSPSDYVGTTHIPRLSALRMSTLPVGGTCPPPIYKRVVYTLGGQPLEQLGRNLETVLAPAQN